MPTDAPRPSAARTPSDALSKLEAFFASLELSRATRPAPLKDNLNILESTTMPSRPPSVPTEALESYYDDIVQAMVQRAWRKAWTAYQSGGLWTPGGGTAAVPIPSGPPPLWASESYLSDVSASLRTSSPHTSPRRSTQTTRSAAPASYVSGHPHLPASARRAKVSYAQSHALRAEHKRQQFLERAETCVLTDRAPPVLEKARH